VFDSEKTPRKAVEISVDLLTQIKTLYEKYYGQDKDKTDSSILQTMKKDPLYNTFTDVAIELQVVDISSLLPDERKVFWINVYNALLLHSYLELEFPSTALQKVSMMPRVCYNIGKFGVMSLYDIEYTILRGNMCKPNVSRFSSFISRSKEAPDPGKKSLLVEPDPRLHFCLHMMCKSSPPLNVYTIENLNHELNNSMIYYLEHQVDLHVDAKKKVLTLPKMFEWYAKDFVGSEKELIKLPSWIAKLVKLSDFKKESKLTAYSAFLEKNATLVKFSSFNWDFNFVTIKYN